jgi:hypothetical protein
LKEKWLPVSEHAEVELSVQLDVLVEAASTVDLSAQEDALRMRGPFGELSIPYACMTKVTKDAAGGIMLDVASAKVWLDDFRDRDALIALLQEKITTSRGQH